MCHVSLSAFDPLRHGLLLNLKLGWDSANMSRDHPVSSSPSAGVIGMCTTLPGSYVASRDSETGAHA